MTRLLSLGSGSPVIPMGAPPAVSPGGSPLGGISDILQMIMMMKRFESEESLAGERLELEKKSLEESTRRMQEERETERMDVREIQARQAFERDFRRIQDKNLDSLQDLGRNLDKVIEGGRKKVSSFSRQAVKLSRLNSREYDALEFLKNADVELGRVMESAKCPLELSSSLSQMFSDIGKVAGNFGDSDSIQGELYRIQDKYFDVINTYVVSAPDGVSNVGMRKNRILEEAGKVIEQSEYELYDRVQFGLDEVRAGVASGEISRTAAFGRFKQSADWYVREYNPPTPKSLFDSASEVTNTFGEARPSVAAPAEAPSRTIEEKVKERYGKERSQTFEEVGKTIGDVNRDLKEGRAEMMYGAPFSGLLKTMGAGLRGTAAPLPLIPYGIDELLRNILVSGGRSIVPMEGQSPEKKMDLSLGIDNLKKQAELNQGTLDLITGNPYQGRDYLSNLFGGVREKDFGSRLRHTLTGRPFPPSITGEEMSEELRRQALRRILEERTGGF